jgi:hypothetical protein
VRLSLVLRIDEETGIREERTGIRAQRLRGGGGDAGLSATAEALPVARTGLPE